MKWNEIIAQGHTTPGERSDITACYDNPVKYAVLETYPAGRYDLIDCSLNRSIDNGAPSEQIDAILNGLQVNDDRWQVYTTQLCVFECVMSEDEVAFMESLSDVEAEV